MQRLARPSGTRTRRLVLVPLLCLTSCHVHPPAPAVAPKAEPANAQEASQALDAAKRDRSVLNATDLHLPVAADGASTATRQFYAAATRAVQHTYEDDVDDPSQLLALEQRLGRDASLRPLRPVWRPILHASLARAATLRALGPTLRALRQAIANSWRDEMTHTYRDVDEASCGIARAQLPSDPVFNASHLRDTVVTIEPLGAYPLAVFLRFCDDPRSLFDHE